MEILESLGWIVLGFVPTMCALEIAWKVGVAKKYKVKVKQEKKVSANVLQYWQQYRSIKSSLTADSKKE